MELLEKFIWVIVAIVCILILISMAWNFLIHSPQEKIKIKGDKNLIVSRITNLIYKCFEENEGKKTSVICFQVDFESDQEIFSSDILNKINPSRLAAGNVIVDNLGISGKIIIRYENQLIYVKRVESEGISL